MLAIRHGIGCFIGMSPEPEFRGSRLFVAIELPDYIKEALLKLSETRRKGFHWVPPERLHLTLRFIGDFPGQFQPEIETALEDLSVEPFFLPVQGVGKFPPKGQPHAVWAGLGSGHPHLFQLKKKIEDALFNIGIQPEKRIYHPHITLARVNHAAPETVRQFLKEFSGFEAPPFRVERFALFRSGILNEHRVHTLQQVWELGRDQDSGGS